jgi:hypothetical protein
MLTFRGRSSGVLVPILVQGPSGASEARRPSPLMTAPGTPAARRKGVPGSAAGREGRFRRSRTFAPPTARGGRTPATQRASDPVEGVLVHRTILVERDPARCTRVPIPGPPGSLDIRGRIATQTRHRPTIRVIGPSHFSESWQACRRTQIVARTQSARSAMIGSTRVARLAGTQLARIVTVASTRAVAPKLRGSVGVTL